MSTRTPSDRPNTSTSVFADLVYELLHSTTLDAAKRRVELAEAWRAALTLEFKAIQTVGETLKRQGMRLTPWEEEALNKHLSEALKIVETMQVEARGPTEVAQPQSQQAMVQEPPKTPGKSRLPVPKGPSGVTPKKFT